MTLDPQMLYSAVRIIGDLHPKVFDTTRETIGTGFLITVRSESDPKTRYGYVVTAAHVLEDQTAIEVQVPRPVSAGGMYEPIPIRDWHQPLEKVDLALALLPFTDDDPRPFFALELETNLVPNDRILGLTLGAPMLYIGILAPLDRVMVRMGRIGALDQEDLKLRGGYEYPAHLIDCRSYMGFSGSPVFAQVLRPGLVVKPPPVELPGVQMPLMGEMNYFVFLAGMFTAHLSEPSEFAVSRYGVGVMLRGQEIREALMADEVRQDRVKSVCE